MIDNTLEFKDRIDANIGYQRYFMNLAENIHLKEHWSEAFFKDRLGVELEYFFGDANEKGDILEQMALVKAHLHGAHLPFQCKRAVIKGIHLKLTQQYKAPTFILDRLQNISDSFVILSFYEEVNILQVQINLSLREATTADCVFAHQMTSNDWTFQNRISTDNLSITNLQNYIAKALSPSWEDAGRAYLIEINDFCGYTSIDELMKSQNKRLYGILSGDEGYEFVPPALAEKRIENAWSSRAFVKVIGFGFSCMLLNLNGAQIAKEYRAKQKSSMEKYYGTENPYFALQSPMAGLNHGVFFAIEVPMIINGVSAKVLQERPNHETLKPRQLAGRMKQTKAYRKELLSTLEKVEKIGMSEMGALENFMFEIYRVTPVMDKIKRLLDIMDSELEILYRTRTDNRMGLLTAASVFFAAGSVLCGAAALWVAFQ